MKNIRAENETNENLLDQFVFDTGVFSPDADSFSEDDNYKIKEYIDTYVICSECNRPDTHLVKQGRTTLIRCDACGAFRSVKSRKKKVVQQPSAKLKEGLTLELTIKDIGRKGDGIAYHDKYTIYVAGAIKGSTVKVKIEKISGTVAFGHIIEV